MKKLIGEKPKQLNNLVYVAAAMPLAHLARHLRQTLRMKGYDPVYSWPERATSYGAHLGVLQMTAEAKVDLAEMRRCDWLVVIGDPDKLSSGGNHTELGVALERGACCCVIGHRGNIFHHLPQVGWYVDQEDFAARFPDYRDGLGPYPSLPAIP